MPTRWDVERKIDDHRRRVEEVRRQLHRDGAFFDGLALNVHRQNWGLPFDWPSGAPSVAGHPVYFSVLGIGMGGNAGSVKCSGEAHAAWLEAGIAYVDAVDAATQELVPAYRRFVDTADLLGTRVLRWRLREARDAWVRAQEVFLSAVRTAEEAYRPVAEAILAASAATERGWAELRAERERKCRELAAREVWGIAVLAAEGEPDTAVVYRHDVQPRYRPPADAVPHRRIDDEPLTAYALEPALQELYDAGAGIRWESAAESAVERETECTVSGWWGLIFPGSRVLRRSGPLPGSTPYTGTSHHSSYGAGGFSCATSF